ncbi:hypothetical protein AKJ09_03734 [Labilithrix luteola]|uniref:Uncharacterized protein n=1 Tax=Labilithrix luteola TaxID=1391654 RepID=A0A0K1PU58_9BACT|nr:hypothetical protein AKJ09_03734 [Labilithrix luteola]
MAWLERHGYIGRSSRTASEGTQVNDARRSPLEACVSIATQKETTRALASDDRQLDDRA